MAKTNRKRAAKPAAPKRDIVERNDNRLAFTDHEDAQSQITFERNVGQGSFRRGVDALILIDGNDGEGPWFMVRADAEELQAWLAGVLSGK